MPVADYLPFFRAFTILLALLKRTQAEGRVTSAIKVASINTPDHRTLMSLEFVSWPLFEMRVDVTIAIMGCPTPLISLEELVTTL